MVLQNAQDQSVVWDNTGITVVVDSLGKLSRALLTGVDRVVFGGESYSHEFITDDMYQKAVELAHGAGAEIVFNTPRIIRQSDVPAFHKWLENIAHSGADGISVHNIGTLYAVQQYTDIPVEADYSLISYNQETLKHLSELGAVRAVLSPELNFTQIEALGKNTPLALECMVEGNLELMVSEYCCTGSFLGDLHTGKCSAPCVRSGKKFFLKDIIKNDVSSGNDQGEAHYLSMGLEFLKRLFQMSKGWSRYHAWSYEATEEVTYIWETIQPHLADYLQETLKKCKSKKMTKDIRSASAGFVIAEAMKNAGLKYRFTGQTYRAKVSVMVTKDRCITLYIAYSKLDEQLPRIMRSLTVIKEELEALGDGVTINKALGSWNW